MEMSATASVERCADIGADEALDLVLVVAGGDPDSLPPLPLLEGREAVGGRATAFVCRDFTCSLPIHDPAGLSRELDGAQGKVSGF